MLFGKGFRLPLGSQRDIGLEAKGRSIIISHNIHRQEIAHVSVPLRDPSRAHKRRSVNIRTSHFSAVTLENFSP